MGSLFQFFVLVYISNCHRLFLLVSVNEMILLVACSYLHVELRSFIIVVDLGEKSNKAEVFFFYFFISSYVDFDFLIFGRKSNIKAEIFFVCACARKEAHGFFKAFHTLIAFLISILGTSIGFHFQGLGVSPFETHFATFLVLIMAAIVYSIAYMGTKLQRLGANYLLLFRLICLVSGIIAIELLISVMISPFWLFVVNFLPILIVGVLCSYKQIYQFLYYIANLIFNAVPSLLKKREDNDNQGTGNV